MPRIPLFQANTVIRSPGMSPAAAAAPYRALSRAGESIRQTGEEFGRVASLIEEKEKKAARAVKALKIETGLRNDIDSLAESFQMRTDYEAFEDDAGNQLKEIRAKYEADIGEDRELSLAFERVYAGQSSSLMRVVRDKKRQVITSEGIGQFEIQYNQALKDYAAEMSPEARELVRKQLQMKAYGLVNNSIMTLKQAETYIQNFDDEADAVRADQYIEADPAAALEALKSGGFDDLSPKVKQAKIEKAQTKIDQQEREQRLADDRKEKALARIRKQVVDKNDLDMWQAYYGGTLKESDLEKLADNQMISESVYKGIKEKLIKGERVTENNAEIVGDIGARVELRDFKGAYDRLTEAHASGQVKGETYIGLHKSIASKQFSDAVGYINKAMQPSDLEIDFFKKQKHADAIADLAVRTASGENPIEAAKDIVSLNRTLQSSSYARYRNPRYMKGEKDNLVQLADAKYETVEAYKRGEITDQEYKAEIELIEKIEAAVAERDRMKSTDEDLDKAMKDLGVGKR